LLILHSTLFAEDTVTPAPVTPEKPLTTEETPVPAKLPVEKPSATEEETAAKSPVPSAVRESLAGLLNQDLQKATIVPSLIKGLYEVTVNSEVLYITADGQHLITGNIIDAKTRKNLTDGKRDILRAKAIDTIAEKEMVTRK